ncbi:septal ring lytic transglycosylase RlpA family protein [Aquabacter sp. CN5-332]|uniref:septal ring lytic transglycosylase RlpA family protein n=1 Tax=Aquabacter sp. CN5-332 TaxID=3156608 RepID=UPI0032B5853C
MGALTQPALADVGQTGMASYYWQGKGTASGERFNASALTAAHRSLPFNTKVKVTNLRNGRSVVVRINDRGPFVRGRIIDVSRAAASELGFTGHGITRVNVAVMGRDTELAATETPDSGKAQTAPKAEDASPKTAAASKPKTAPKTQVASIVEKPEPDAPASAPVAAKPAAPTENGGWTLLPSPGVQPPAQAQPAE